MTEPLTKKLEFLDDNVEFWTSVARDLGDEPEIIVICIEAFNLIEKTRSKLLKAEVK